ncbi:hypothetical protein FOG48_04017 [Hanseniaspora uvarum]|nr:hypothetical protein FOG48_04017 [Hanseniaspora uvarum]
MSYQEQYNQALTFLKDPSSVEKSLEILSTLNNVPYAEFLDTNINQYNSSKSITETLKEKIIVSTGEALCELKRNDDLSRLILHSQDVIYDNFRSKLSKILKKLIEFFKIDNRDIALQINTVDLMIDFANSKQRKFWANTLLIESAYLEFQNKNYKKSLEILQVDLISSFKKLDDKASLIDLYILEFKNYYQLKNFVKAKNSLIACKTIIQSVYVNTLITAELDMLNGIIFCENKDYQTAYSYFYESFNSYYEEYIKLLNISNDKTRSHNRIQQVKLAKIYEILLSLLKYMILCKIMANKVTEIESIYTLQAYRDTFKETKELNFIKDIVKAYTDNSLLEFNKILSNSTIKDELILKHLNILYDMLLTNNLIKIIGPFDCIEIQHISNLIGMPYTDIENKLSQLILDNKIYGKLNQDLGYLYIFEVPKEDTVYEQGSLVINELSQILDKLYEKATVLQ